MTLVGIIVLQRFAIPIGGPGVSLAFVLTLVVVLVLAVTGGLVHDLTRVLLFTAATAACGVAAWLYTLGGHQISTASFFLLIVVYLPWLFRVPESRGRQAGAAWLSRLFIRTMLAAAAVAVLQMVTQLLDVWTYVDPIKANVAEPYLLAAYNTSIPIEYASPIVKSQAFVFLEPSFLSQFLGLAIILGILTRIPLWQLGLLGVAMFCTYSGTGIILLAVGVVLILLRSPRSIRPSMIVLAAVALTALLLSPYAAPLLNRTSEAGDNSSSLSLRFVIPYEQVAAGLEQEPQRYLRGAGPGASERVLESDREGSGLAVVYTVAPKLLFEYGMLAGSLFLLFFLVTLLRRGPYRVIPGSLIVMLGFLSGSLLQPHVLLVAWLLSAVWARE